MFAIINKKTKEWVFGTDYRYHPPHQRISTEQALTYYDREYAEVDFKVRKCNKNYEIVEVELRLK